MSDSAYQYLQVIFPLEDNMLMQQNILYFIEYTIYIAEEEDAENMYQDPLELGSPMATSSDADNGNVSTDETDAGSGGGQGETITHFMLQRFGSLDLSNQDGAFVTDLKVRHPWAKTLKDLYSTSNASACSIAFYHHLK